MSVSGSFRGGAVMMPVKIVQAWWRRRWAEAFHVPVIGKLDAYWNSAIVIAIAGRKQSRICMIFGQVPNYCA
jgi:hypothetical protein